MLTNTQNISIKRDPASLDDKDFSFLREEGIRYIQELGGKLWTDYNTHDPGITMLEVLCYAITDLGNRIDQPIENLLSDPGKGIEGQFFTIQEILPAAPTNALDYRKLIIDLDGVKNCWIYPKSIPVYANLKLEQLSYSQDIQQGLSPGQKTQFNLRGLCTIVVDIEEDELSKALENQINKAYHAHRNLCEDLYEIRKVERHPISVCANIEVKPEADEELVHAHILEALENYLAPEPRFHSLTEMMDKGYRMDEIFEGPLLEHGFLDDEELAQSTLRTQVRLSDIIQLIMNIEGVTLIKEITLQGCEEGISRDASSWIMCIPAGMKPVLCSKTTLNYFKGVLPININQSKVQDYRRLIRQAKAEQALRIKEDLEPSFPKGQFLPIGDYISVQQNFPENYGLSDKGLPPHLGPERKAKTLQLKAYLLFFDQILASYFKQLEQVKSMLSVHASAGKTYTTQAVKGLKNIEKLLDPSLLNDEEQLYATVMSFLDDPIKRNNKILDHLISRFAENFGQYAFLMKFLYGNATDEVILEDKVNFLKNYPVLSRDRGQAFNYYHQPTANLWNSTNVSGLQRRIASLTGMPDFSRRNISNSPLEIYKYGPEGADPLYRWRLRNQNGNIVLSATTSYESHDLAGREFYFALLKILETDAEALEKARVAGIGAERQVESFHFHRSSTGKYSFDIINPEVEATSSADYIIAKQYHYFSDGEQVIEAALALISFVKKKFTEEGIFLVEHLLLKPMQEDAAYAAVSEETEETYEIGEFLGFCADDYPECNCIDPYSFRVSIILPGYTYRFANKDFRDYLENLIRQELPAHILAKVCWIGYRKGEEPEIKTEDVENTGTKSYKENQLVKFEKAYKEFLLERTKLDTLVDKPNKLQKYNKVLNTLIDSMAGLHSIYPTGKLYDCEDENEELTGKIILGKTNLGNL